MSLEQDYTTVPGQLYACLSVVGPEAPQKNDTFGIKIRGAFASRDEAANHAKRLQKEDTTFDIYVVDMYKWLLIPRMFNDRKRDMMETKSFLKPGDENSRFYTKPDEKPISHPADVIERLRKDKPDTPMEDLVKEADAIVAAEVEERRKLREAEDAASTNGTIEEGKEEEGEEVTSEKKD